MKKVALMLVLIVALAMPVFAQEFPDVPADHWAYQAVNELLNAGIVQGYPDGTYGGKRAMTRYEFAEAVAKAIPYIEQKVKAGIPGATAAGAVDLSGYAKKEDLANFVTKDQLAALQKLVDEFRDELAALGVDVEALRRDVAALNERVTALEEEVARVRFTGEADFYARGEVTNSGAAEDIDGRALVVAAGVDEDNPLANSSWFNNLAFGMKAKAGAGVTLNSKLMVGNYMDYAIGTSSDFQLWNLNADAALKMGPLGMAQVKAGRQNLQLTPLTFKLVDPDYFTNVSVLDSGDYVVDGASATFTFGKTALTAFAAKTGVLGGLQTAKLQTAPNNTDGEIAQVGGVRAVIGGLLNGNLGLTWYDVGLAPGSREMVYGADYNGTFGSLGLSGEYAKVSPNDQFKAVVDDPFDGDSAYNAKLSYKTGSLGLGVGYDVVEADYNAPGNWMRVGQMVNLQNVEGYNANLSYDMNNLSIIAKGCLLTPYYDDFIHYRSAWTQVAAEKDFVDQLINYKVDLNYKFSASCGLNLGWEQSTLSSTAAIADVKESYYTVGLGHTFNPTASMKLQYQIMQVDGGVSDYRGGIASATMQLKY